MMMFMHFIISVAVTILIYALTSVAVYYAQQVTPKQFMMHEIPNKPAGEGFSYSSEEGWEPDKLNCVLRFSTCKH